MALRLIGNTYHVYWVSAGRQYTRSTHTSDLREARGIEHTIMMSVRMQRMMSGVAEIVVQDRAAPSAHVPLSPAPSGSAAHRRGTVCLSDMWDLAMRRRPSLGSVRTNRQAWERFVQAMPYRFADQITPRDCLAYLDAHYGSGNGKSWNNNRSILNTIFRLCLVDAGLTASPFAPLCQRQIDSAAVESHRPLSDEEVGRIMSAPRVHEYVRCMTMLGRWTGQRLETCARITRRMLHDDGSSASIIMPGKTSRYNKHVILPYLDPLRDYIASLSAQLDGTDPDTPLVEALGITRTARNKFSTRFIELLASLDIRDDEHGKASFHSLRASFITYLKDMGVSADTRRDITGHSSLATEDIYASNIARVSALASSLRTQKKE